MTGGGGPVYRSESSSVLHRTGLGAHPAQEALFGLEPAADTAMTYFYSRLFALDDELRAMFPPALDGQRRRLFHALVRIAGGQHDPAALEPYLQRLGRSHRKFGAGERHYAVFRAALLETLQRFAWAAWDEPAQLAWERAFDHAAQVMASAAERDAEHAPAWWVATVTGRQLRGPDLAVLTVAPDPPLEYQPGQHVAVQTPHRPRLWRSYSVANAPRPDGLLQLHVRALPGGLVSPALVQHVRPGDPLLLGAAEGAMTADATSPRDVLCLAGGTGLAPVKAIIEALIGAAAPGTARPREVMLVAGARRHRELYDLAALQEMERAYPWLQVIPAVSDEPGPGVMFGTVPEVAAKAPCQDRDIYVSGPDAMMVKTVQALAYRGVPGSRIHCDLGVPAG